MQQFIYYGIMLFIVGGYILICILGYIMFRKPSKKMFRIVWYFNVSLALIPCLSGPLFIIDAYRRIINSGGAEFTVSKGKMAVLFSSMIMYCIGLIFIIQVLDQELWH